MTHLFLSPEWVAAVDELRAEYADRVPPAPVEIAADITVRGAPFSDEPLAFHLVTDAGIPMLAEGHQDGATVTVTVDYDVAVMLFRDRDPAAVMGAFFDGRLLVQGDLAPLLALQGLQNETPDPEVVELVSEVAEKLTGFTSLPEA